MKYNTIFICGILSLIFVGCVKTNVNSQKQSLRSSAEKVILTTNAFYPSLEQETVLTRIEKKKALAIFLALKNPNAINNEKYSSNSKLISPSTEMSTLEFYFANGDSEVLFISESGEVSSYKSLNESDRAWLVQLLNKHKR